MQERAKHFVEVGFKPGIFDAFGRAAKEDIKELGFSVQAVSYVDVYNFFAELSKEETEKIAKELLVDAITHHYSINKALLEEFDWEITVEYHANVTDNVGLMTEEGLKDLGIKLKEGEKVRTGRKYVIKGSLKEEEVKKICKDLLANEIIERFFYRKGKRMN